jgi:hypothetical protein
LQQRRFYGDILERQSFLNGTRYFLVEGSESELGDGDWSWTLSVTLPKVEGDIVQEGDLSLQHGDAAWYADVVGGGFSEELDEATEAPLTVVQLELRRREDAGNTLTWTGANATLRIAVETCELALEAR